MRCETRVKKDCLSLLNGEKKNTFIFQIRAAKQIDMERCKWSKKPKKIHHNNQKASYVGYVLNNFIEGSLQEVTTG